MKVAVAYWSFVAALVLLGVWQLGQWSPTAGVVAFFVALVGVQVVRPDL